MNERLGAARACGLAIAPVLALLWACASPAPAPPDAHASIEIRGVMIEVELADTLPAYARGLAGRTELPRDRGMLFRYDSPGFVTFWMEGMLFDLDVVWIRDARIVGIAAEPVRCSSPRNRPTGASVCKSNCAAIRPTAKMILGSISSI